MKEPAGLSSGRRWHRQPFLCGNWAHGGRHCLYIGHLVLLHVGTALRQAPVLLEIKNMHSTRDSTSLPTTQSPREMMMLRGHWAKGPVMVSPFGQDQPLNLVALALALDLRPVHSGLPGTLFPWCFHSLLPGPAGSQQATSWPDAGRGVPSSCFSHCPVGRPQRQPAGSISFQVTARKAGGFPWGWAGCQLLGPRSWL